jgi:hypothetical protein
VYEYRVAKYQCSVDLPFHVKWDHNHAHGLIFFLHRYLQNNPMLEKNTMMKMVAQANMASLDHEGVGSMIA